MAAGLGFKTFTTGEVLTAADVNGYLMQGILVFANAAARTSAVTSPQEGQYSYLKDTNALEYYDGAAWVGAPVGDITAVTAGTGISGGGSSGAVTITNDMATTITASGDIVVGTGNGTYDNLPIGSTGQVLTADTTVSPYKVKWAAAGGGAALTKITSASFTTQSSVAIDDVFTATYKRYMVLIDVLASTSVTLRLQFRYAGPTTQALDYFGSNFEITRANTQTGNGFVNTTTATLLNTLETTSAQMTMYFSGVGNTSENPSFWFNGFNSGDSQASILGGGRNYTSRTYTGFLLSPDTGTITGNYQVYGLEN